MDQVQRNIHQRDEHEGSFVQARMREGQRLGFKNEIIVEQDVEVDPPRPIAETGLASLLDLKQLEALQKGFWPEAGLALNCHVQEGWLVRVTPRRRLVNARLGQHVYVRCKRLNSGAQVGEPIPQVRAKREIDDAHTDKGATHYDLAMFTKSANRP